MGGQKRPERADEGLALPRQTQQQRRQVPKLPDAAVAGVRARQGDGT